MNYASSSSLQSFRRTLGSRPRGAGDTEALLSTRESAPQAPLELRGLSEVAAPDEVSVALFRVFFADR